MDLFVAILLLIVGFVILIKGADFLVEGAASVAKQFGISDLIIGLTIVSMGTSAPELVVNINVAIKSMSTDPEGLKMIFGNVFGSNIFNTCLILGVAGMIIPLAVQKNTAFKELPFSLFIVLIVFFLGNDVMFLGATKNTFSRLDGGTLLVFFVGFLLYIYKNAKTPQQEIAMTNVDTGEEENSLDTDLTELKEDEEEIKVMPTWRSSIYILLGIGGLLGGGTLVLDKSIFLAETFGMTKRVIGLTVVAIGTSLPELATSAVSAAKGNSDIAVGNVIGSNVFNILLVLAVSTVITPVDYDIASNFDIYFLVGATVLLFGFLFIGSKGTRHSFLVDKWQAGVLLLAVTIYTVYLIAYAK